MKYLFTTLLLLLLMGSHAQEWEIKSTREISKSLPKDYKDNIELSGKQVSGIITYDIDEEGYASIRRHLIYPQLRTHIADTDDRWKIYRAYLKEDFDDTTLPHIYVEDRRLIPGKVEEITIDGTLLLRHQPSKSGITIKRQWYPSIDQAIFMEEWTLTNATDSVLQLQIGNILWDQDRYGPYGKYILTLDCITDEEVSLRPGESTSFRINYSARREQAPEYIYRDELMERYFLLDDIHDNLVFESPNETINTLFAFSKVRATESIFDSKMGLVHSPGGGRYYVGVWANDQAEYAGPFFPYLGLEDGNTASLNAYQQFFNQMKTIPNHDKALWASHEMNGEIPCCGTDRGDAAMIAFGGLHYLMALGDKSIAEAYEPMIDWCLTYNHKHLNSDGVVLSASDEMEGRIPTGTANLSTSALYFGALDLAINYYSALGYPLDKINELEQRKSTLKQAIDSYFGAHIEGLDTYKYFKEHQYLRHWICLPLVVGLHERKAATITALLDRLWTDNGVHVEKNAANPDVSKIFWDRGTLYALRGTFIAGATDASYDKLVAFSSKRLLGDRVPYMVEAYPEGNMAHLSAESALYCRLITEGMFGIKPTGFDKFILSPRMPSSWNNMALRRIQAFGRDFDIEINRKSGQLLIKVLDESEEVIFEDQIKEGDSVEISLF